MIIKSIVLAPIVSSDNKLLGVVEMFDKQNDEIFLERDLYTLQTFAFFASITIDNSRFKDIIEYGDVDIEIDRWMNESEKKDTKNIPQHLVLSKKQLNCIHSINYFTIDYKGIGLFKQLFYLFNYFHLLETPFVILFKDQSVMEMHHIITRNDINLFHKLNID